MKVSYELSFAISIVDATFDAIPLVATISNVAILTFRKLADIFNIQWAKPFTSNKSNLECFIKMIPLWGQIEHFKSLSIKAKLVKKAKSIDALPKLYKTELLEALKKETITPYLLPAYYAMSNNFIDEAIDLGIDVLRFPYQLKIDNQKIEKILRKNGAFLRSCPDSIKKNIYYQNIALESNAKAIFEITTGIIDREDVVKKALKDFSKEELFCLYIQLSDALKERYRRQFLEKNGLILELIPNADQTLELAQVAVRQEGLAIEFVRYDLAKNLKLQEAAVEQDPMALQFIPKPHPFDSEKLIGFVKIKGECINFLGDELKHRADVKIFAIKNNPKALPKLYKAHHGHLQAMITSILKEAVDHGFFDILNCAPEDVCSLEVVQYIFNHAKAEDKALFFRVFAMAIPIHVLFYLADRAEVESICDNHPLIVIAKYHKMKTDLVNATGCPKFIKKTRNLDAISGFDLESTYYEINPEAIQNQRATHTGYLSSFKKADYKKVFDRLLSYVSTRPDSVKQISEKKQKFIREESFFASFKDGTKELAMYYSQLKQQLSHIAGYIEQNPEDTGILDHLERGFNACAGGIQAEIEQIFDLYITYPKDSTLEYRFAKMISDLLNRSIEASLMVPQNAPIEFGQGPDVHMFNAFRKLLGHFLLTPPVEDQFKKEISKAQLQKFFSFFNLNFVLKELYDQVNTSKTLQQTCPIELRKYALEIFGDEISIEDFDVDEAEKEYDELFEDKASYDFMTRTLEHELVRPKKDQILRCLNYPEAKLIESLTELLGTGSPLIDPIKSNQTSYKKTIVKLSICMSSSGLESRTQIFSMTKAQYVEACRSNFKKDKADDRMEEFLTLEDGKYINEEIFFTLLEVLGFIRRIDPKKYIIQEEPRGSIFGRFGNFDLRRYY